MLGIHKVYKAVEIDNKKIYYKALYLYKEGVKLLIEGKKLKKNIKIKYILLKMIHIYLKRIKELEKISQNQNYLIKKRKSKSIENNYSSKIEYRNLKEILKNSILLDKPNIKWEEVAGLNIAKEILKETVILPIAFPQLFEGKRKPWSGILLFGPPGTGKSYLAKAVATEANNSTFFNVSSSDLLSKFVGDSEKLVKILFTLAQDKKPSIIFLDECDSLASNRNSNETDNLRRIKTEFLIQMQGVGKDLKGILTLGATNCPWDLDPAFRRRFQKRIYIALPDLEDRKKIFIIHVGKTKNSLTEKNITELAYKTKGFSSSDISNVVKDALMEPIRSMQLATYFKKIIHPFKFGQFGMVPCKKEDFLAIKMTLMDIPINKRTNVIVNEVVMKDFLSVLLIFKASVAKEDLLRYEIWKEKFGQEG